MSASDQHFIWVSPSIVAAFPGPMMTIAAMKALAAAADDPTPRLSTDYLNRYGEALMLLEMVPMDASIVDDLKAWRSVGYQEHFLASELRCTASALMAYDDLDSAHRAGFEDLCGAMNRLIVTATALLADMPAGQDATAVVDVAGESLRNLIGRATQFINANGFVDIATVDGGGLQDEIDALFAS